MEENTIKDILEKIELQFENWKYDELELTNCSFPVISVEGRRYD